VEGLVSAHRIFHSGAALSDSANPSALIVDFGGVLTTPLQDAFAAFADAMNVELSDLVRVLLRAYTGEDDNLVTGFEMGRISEEDFSAELAARLSEVCGRPIESKDLVARLFSGMRIEQEMVTAVELARQAGIKTGLLSNSWGTGTYPREIIDPLFDVIVISGEVGMRKPDPEIFRVTAEKLGVHPDECVFVDDHPGHLKAALELGMKTVLHRSPKETLDELEAILDRPLRPID
jgi:epoxide hydrolase-like predicted phosphatase